MLTDKGGADTAAKRTIFEQAMSPRPLSHFPACRPAVLQHDYAR